MTVDITADTPRQTREVLDNIVSRYTQESLLMGSAVRAVARALDLQVDHAYLAVGWLVAEGAYDVIGGIIVRADAVVNGKLVRSY